MSWARKPHPVEVAIEWLAPVPLALAVGWASWRIGLSSIESVGLGGCALAAGHLAFKLGSGNRLAPLQGFQPAEFASIEPDELVLEETDAVLELNDRLEQTTSDARVVRLFERQEPTPGELVDRIVDFLAEGRGPTQFERPAVEGGRPPDASAALHDALANIRASLR